MPQKKIEKGHSVRDACILEAMRVVEDEGLENLSLRRVARRLGISHQAPYKHFPSRDHILAELVAKSFEEFAAYLNARPQTDNAHDDLRNMGKHYVEFALKHPTRYRMMFNTQLPPIAEHPNMMAKAKHAFELLTEGLARFPKDEVDVDNRSAIESDALFIWASVHGMVSIFQSDSVSTLELSDETLNSIVPHILQRLERAFRGNVPAEIGDGEAHN